mmetsp:Transcript_24912/g.37241  ORF Transcript_24912/g.37241 Transcript_24912/m.37241 type:complete len:335 (-) Transcript_24912:191-1195(-)
MNVHDEQELESLVAQGQTQTQAQAPPQKAPFVVEHSSSSSSSDRVQSLEIDVNVDELEFEPSPTNNNKNNSKMRKKKSHSSLASLASFSAYRHKYQHQHQYRGASGKYLTLLLFTFAVIVGICKLVRTEEDDLSFVSSSSSSSSSSVAGHDHTSLISQVLSLTQSRGGLASLAVLFHEIPHELGDFSILVSAGMTKKQAIMTQFSTAIAAYCGTFFGLLGMEQMKSVLGYDLMIPFTAGGFVYLAGVTILPSLLQEKRSFTMRIVQFMSFVIGISFMYFVAVLEHQEGGGHSHSAHEHEHEHDHVEDHSHGHVDHHDHHSHEHGHGYDHHHDEF